MELTLNLVWACVAIAGILAQLVMLSRAAASAERTASSWRKIVAMGCVLVILFFVISMTDDLHGQEILIEEKRLSRMTMAGATNVPGPVASARSIPTGFLAFFPPESFSPSLPVVRRLLEPSKWQFPAAAEQRTIRGRAPPVSVV